MPNYEEGERHSPTEEIDENTHVDPVRDRTQPSSKCCRSVGTRYPHSSHGGNPPLFPGALKPGIATARSANAMQKYLRSQLKNQP